MDDVIYELSKSCKFLSAIDISKCFQLTAVGVKRFLENIKVLTKFWANHDADSINDESLLPLKNHKELTNLSINFCHEVTVATIEILLDKKFTYLSLSSLPKITNEGFNKIISASEQTLTHLDISFNREEVNNALMAKVGNCTKL